MKKSPRMSSEWVAIVGSLGCLYGVSFLGCLWPVISMCQRESGPSCPAWGSLSVSCLGSASGTARKPPGSVAGQAQDLSAQWPFSQETSNSCPHGWHLTQKILWRTWCFWSPEYLFLVKQVLKAFILFIIMLLAKQKSHRHDHKNKNVRYVYPVLMELFPCQRHATGKCH